MYVKVLFYKDDDYDDDKKSLFKLMSMNYCSCIK